MNPYKKLPDYHFWRQSVSNIAKHQIDPVIHNKFAILQNDKIGTAGSCFAQHIARELQRNKFKYHVTEDGKTVDPKTRKQRNYGVFSARYGNIYTVKQLLQLLEEATTNKQRHIVWKMPQGGLADALRPSIEPQGFDSVQALADDREQHLQRVRQLFQDVDIFIFTLGLTEAWIAAENSTVFPMAPGIVAGCYDPEKYHFHNFTAAEVIADLHRVLELLTNINPKIKVILTVSPVPLTATYQGKHVLTANTYSKSVLRVAAGEVEAQYHWVDYFPSYEIITGPHSRSSYYEGNLRNVTAPGIAHVMRVFLKHYTNMDTGSNSPASVQQTEGNLQFQEDDVICDEELIAKMNLLRKT